jgi:N-acetylmuramoyl-L-alanine amidase
MGANYLTQLANWCREAGLTVVEYDGWQTRARSSGGFESGRPWCIMWHHTASKTSPANDASYMCHGSPDKPIANILLARDGVVWVLAAGATNTNGKGKAIGVSKGTVPKDSMNTYAVGIEIANNGVGEPYSQAQIDAAFVLSNTLAEHLSLHPTDVCTHQFYAPDRKIDPATAMAVQGPWRPDSVTSSGTWDQSDLEAECLRRVGAEPPDPDPDPPPAQPGYPVPAPTKDDVSMVVALDSNGTAWVGDGITRQPITDASTFDNMVLLGKQGCYRFVNTQGQGVNGWGNVQTVGQVTIEALGRERS